MKSVRIYTQYPTKQILNIGYKSLAMLLAVIATMAGEFAIIILIHKLP